MPEGIVSVDHEWAQALPLLANALVCLRCGYSRPMAAQNAEPCVPHGEFAKSGWTDMHTGKHRDGRQ